MNAKRPLKYLLLMILFLLISLLPIRSALADPTIPPTWDVIADDFENGSLDQWRISSQAPVLASNSGVYGTTGLAVPVNSDSAYIYQSGVAKAEEGYLSFWFNPNNVSIPEPDPNWWPPGTSLALAEVVHSEDWWPPLVSIYLRQPPGEGYQAFLAWPTDEEGNRTYDWENPFDISNGWQRITVGFRVDEWMAVWIDGKLVQFEDATVVHPDPYADIVFFGKVRGGNNAPSGTLLFDEVAFQVPSVDDLWVDTSNGSDSSDGLTAGTALRTIQRAADLAGPGTTVHILPGIYRETVWPSLNGSQDAPVIYIAEDGPGTVEIRGSEAASSLAWTQLGGNTIGLPPGVDPGSVYSTDLSGWGLDGPPRFIVETGGTDVERLPLAREPDWQVTTEWKTHEFWWAADGGSSPATCNPATDEDPNCDYDTRSMWQLTDRTNDAYPGIEAGSLASLGDLTGATIVAIDTLQGHYVYRRTITEHEIASGRVTVDKICEHDGGTGNPGLGWGSKYYVENDPYLLDSPGEWWYDESSGRLYLWPPQPGSPATQDIEISRRDYGFNLRDRSYVTLDGLTIGLVNHSAVYQHNWETHKSYGNTLQNVLLQYANYGLYIEQGVAADAPAANVIDGFTLQDSEIAYTDSQGIRLIDWWEDAADADSFTRSGIRYTLIRNNEFHHLGFRTDGDNAIGLSFTFANKLTFEGNHVHHIAHNGVQFSRSVIQSAAEYDFAPDEIKTGEILIANNIFEKACQLTTDCGGLKLWGSPPDGHVFRDVLITGNIFRNTYGWTYVSEQRGRWTGGAGSDVRGLGGFGLYVDHASGFHAYRNLSYNNAFTDYMVYGRWRDGQLVYVNNVAANSLYGMSLGGQQYDDHGAVDTRVLNNIIINNEAFGMSLGYAEGHYANTLVDNNLYHNNGWRSYEEGGIWHAGAAVIREGSSWDPYQTLAELQAATPWEAHSLEGDPVFWDYTLVDHEIWDGSWPDFHLTSASAAIDNGTTALPVSLLTLLDHFGIEHEHWGAAIDIGRYEAGFAIEALPASQAIESGGQAQYHLQLSPSDLPHSVTLSLGNVPAGLSAVFNTNTLEPTGLVTLTVVHDSSSGTQWYTVPFSGAGGGFTDSAQVTLLVDGYIVHLPVIDTD